MLLWVVLSLCLMFIDLRAEKTHSLRKGLSLLLAPIQWTVDEPLRAYHWLQGRLTTHEKLLAENAHLKAQHLLLQSQMQHLIALEKENRQLFALLKSSPRAGGKVLLGQLLAVHTNPFVKQLLVDKGSRDNIYEGQPVLDAKGVMGQVMRVNPLTSELLLITDTRSAIPIVNTRTSERGIVMGSGQANTLLLTHIPKTADVSVGDILLTSGLGQHYPEGYPVGVINSIRFEPGEQFATIKVKANANVSKSRLVLFVWPSSDAASDSASKRSSSVKSSTVTSKVHASSGQSPGVSGKSLPKLVNDSKH